MGVTEGNTEHEKQYISQRYSVRRNKLKMIFLINILVRKMLRFAT